METRPPDHSSDETRPPDHSSDETRPPDHSSDETHPPDHSGRDDTRSPDCSLSDEMTSSVRDGIVDFMPERSGSGVSTMLRLPVDQQLSGRIWLDSTEVSVCVCVCVCVCVIESTTPSESPTGNQHTAH